MARYIDSSIRSGLAHIRRLAEQGVELPVELSEMLANLDRLTAELGALPAAADVMRDAVAAAKAGKLAKTTPAEIAGLDTRRQILDSAVFELTHDLHRTASGLVGALVKAIRAQHHDPAVEELAKVAERVPGGYSVDELVRAGNHEAAALLASAPIHVDKIDKAQQAVALLPGVQYAYPSGAPRGSRYWSDPAKAPRDLTVETVLGALREGCRPIIATPAEISGAIDAAEAKRAEERAEADRYVRKNYKRLTFM